MRTYKKRPKSTKSTSSTKPSNVGRSNVSQGHDPGLILNFKRRIGNQAVLRLLKRTDEERKAVSTERASACIGYDFPRVSARSPESAEIQAKLTISRPRDEYEEEADRVAEQVMRMPAPERQRAFACSDGERPKSETRHPGQEKLSLQPEHAAENASQPSTTPPLVQKILHSPGQPMDQSARSYFEPRFGHDFGQVRVHSGRQADQAAHSINARAFTTGSHIVLGSAQHAPESREGQQLLAHELAHVIQQSGGSAIRGSGSPRHQGLIQRTPEEAEALISQHTAWWGNLDESLLGREVLRLALEGQLTRAGEVLNALSSTDRDDVAYEFMIAASDSQLVGLAAETASRRFLHRLFDELTAGSVAAEEQQQADRILQVTSRQTVSVEDFDAAATSRRTKIFPFRLPGFTVIDDAPIEARRERGGVWARTVTRVLGTDMFRAETATLPTEYFIGGIVLPETEVIGVRLYDQGGIIHCTTPLFLIQLANATNQRILEKIIEAAGIGLTLGSGALAGLGVEATMAARVLLWADRAAFALGTVTSVLREHRSWLVEHFGSGFMDAVDIVHSATAIYGLARVVFQAPRIIQGLRSSYRSFREAVRSQSSGFSAGERATIQEVSRSTDDLMNQIDNIEGARPAAHPGTSEPATPPASAAGRAGEPVPTGARGTTEPLPEQAPAPPQEQAPAARPPGRGAASDTPELTVPSHLLARQHQMEQVFARLGGCRGYRIRVCDDATLIESPTRFFPAGRLAKYAGGALTDPDLHVIWVHEELIRNGGLARSWGSRLNINQVVAHEIGHGMGAGAGECHLASRMGANLSGLNQGERLGLLEDAVQIARQQNISLDSLNLPSNYTTPPAPSSPAAP